MILGVDVHKHTHTAALLDPPSGEIATLTFANSADGIARLRDWLADHGGSEAVVGIENAAGYGRLLAAALIAVDDVFTNGFTMREVARALRRAGATEVAGVVLARQPFGG